MKNRNLISLDNFIDREYGPRGTVKREKWEKRFEAFRRKTLLNETNNKTQ